MVDRLTVLKIPNLLEENVQPKSILSLELNLVNGEERKTVAVGLLQLSDALTDFNNTGITDQLKIQLEIILETSIEFVQDATITGTS